MAIETTIRVTCDYPECKNNASQNGPAVVSYVKEDVEKGLVPMPEECQYLVLLNCMGQQKAFCGQLHAAQYFLPPGYEVLRKKVIEFPKQMIVEGVPESEQETDQ